MEVLYNYFPWSNQLQIWYTFINNSLHIITYNYAAKFYVYKYILIYMLPLADFFLLNNILLKSSCFRNSIVPVHSHRLWRGTIIHRINSIFFFIWTLYLNFCNNKISYAFVFVFVCKTSIVYISEVLLTGLGM